MTPLGRRALLAAAVAAVVVLGGVLAGHVGSTPAGDRDPIVPTPSAAAGAVRRFAVRCTPSATARIDPIVAPGQARSDHLHEFFGARVVTATSTVADLRAGATTCADPDDTAAYWMPTLYDGDRRIPPVAVTAYYEVPAGVTPASIETPPAGLQVLSLGTRASAAGDAHDHGSTAARSAPVGWSCDGGTTVDASPPRCGGLSYLSAVLAFPDCWDGRSITGDDTTAGLVGSTDGTCPPTHPHHLPRIRLVVDFPALVPTGLRLSSGPVTALHGDVWNGWDPDRLDALVERCLRRGLRCPTRR